MKEIRQKALFTNCCFFLLLFISFRWGVRVCTNMDLLVKFTYMFVRWLYRILRSVHVFIETFSIIFTFNTITPFRIIFDVMIVRSKQTAKIRRTDRENSERGKWTISTLHSFKWKTHTEVRNSVPKIMFYLISTYVLN